MVPHESARAVRRPDGRVRDNGGVTEPSARNRSAAAADDVLAAAVEVARAAAVETAGDPALVGDHLGATPEPVAPVTGVVAPEVIGAVLTHTFASRLPGYVGWHWAVTLARFPGEDAVTVDEVVLLPGEQALLAPAWVPWHERLRPGDLSVGDVLPSTEDDPRLVPAYTADDDSADDPEGSVVAFELGLGRERVMSREGRTDAAARWSAGEFGPASSMARHAPGPCVTCGFFLPLAGSLRTMLGVCGNAYAPADGRAVTVDYGCGAHSQATLVLSEPVEVVTSARYDTSDYDVLTD
jgi:hypothetical protein